MTGTCLHCGAGFLARQGRKAYCSAECAIEARTPKVSPAKALSIVLAYMDRLARYEPDCRDAYTHAQGRVEALKAQIVASAA